MFNRNVLDYFSREDGSQCLLEDHTTAGELTICSTSCYHLAVVNTLLFMLVYFVTSSDPF